MAKGYIPTQQELQELYSRAQSDPSALDDLMNLNNRLAKRANQRMRDIENKGLEGTAAYNRAKFFIQNQDFGTGQYFSQSRKLDLDDALLNLENISTYLRSQTSTAAGELRRRADIVDKLSDRGYLDMPEDPEDASAFKRKFLDFLDTNAWDDIKKHMYATNSGLLNEASEALQNGAKIGDLTRAFKDYQKGSDTDLFEIWDNWTSGDMYYRSGQWQSLKRPRR